MQPLFGTLIQIGTGVRARQLDQALGQIDSAYGQNQYIRIPEPITVADEKAVIKDTVVFLNRSYGDGTVVAATSAEKDSDLRVIAGNVISYLAERGALPADKVPELQRGFNEAFSEGRAIIDPKGKK